MQAWSEFLLEVMKKKEEIKCSISGCWYRGSSNLEHGLLPKLIWKDKKPNTEENLFRSYLRTRMADPSRNSWFTLIDMQHFGTATRLLDWTESFGVALFFALYSDENPKKPTLWLLNPFTLATRARGYNNKSIGDFHIDHEMDYYARFIKKKDWPYKYAMPFYCPAPNERIHAQRGFFTIHGTDDKSVHLTSARHLRHVEIPQEVRQYAYEFLSLAGIDHSSLFPDHEGWLKKIEKEYFYNGS